MTDAEKKAAQKERLEQKTVVTSRLSETTRFVAFGIVACPTFDGANHLFFAKDIEARSVQPRLLSSAFKKSMEVQK